MGDGFGAVQRAHAVQREDAAVVPASRERRAPFFRFFPAPQPSESQSSGRSIAAVGDEFAILAAGDEPRRDAERAQRHGMARAFIVERETRAVMADLDLTAAMRGPGERRRACCTAVSAAGRYAGRSGLHQKACLMSVSSNS